MSNNLRNQETPKTGSNKLLITLAIAIIALFVIDKLEDKYLPKEVATTQPSETSLAPSKSEVFATATTINKKNLNTKPLNITTDVYSAQINPAGATLTKLDLTGYFNAKDSSEMVSLIHNKTTDGKHGILFDAGWLADKADAPTINSLWETVKSTADSVEFKYENQDLTFYRTIKFSSDKFITTITDKVVNNSDKNISLAHFSQLHHIGEREDRLANSFTNYTGPEALVDGEKTQEDYSSLKDGEKVSLSGKNVWAGVSQQYFANAIIPSNEQINNVKFKYNKIKNDNYYTVLTRSNAENLAPKQEIVKEVKLYAGPKSINILKNQGIDPAIKLDAMLDYGWFHVMAKLFYDAIMWIDAKVGNLALSIIILTFILKVILFPLANKSYVSMAKMRNIQPEMQKLQKKYGNDRQAMGLEMMSLYRKHKVNPASGCWPLLVQIPIFFAMYKVILQSFEFRHAELALWIHDMSEKDPFFVLPIVMGITMIIQQRMNPQPVDETQKMVMNVMPIAFTALFLFFPSGLVLYWLTNNVLSIIQQAIIMKKYAK